MRTETSAAQPGCRRDRDAEDQRRHRRGHRDRCQWLLLLRQSAGRGYVVAVTPPANYQETVDPDSTKDNQTVVNLAACQGKTGVNFGYAGTAPSLSFTQTGPVAARAGDTITYTFTVTNNGNTCFYGGLQIQDPMLGGLIFYARRYLPARASLSRPITW